MTRIKRTYSIKQETDIALRKIGEQDDRDMSKVIDWLVSREIERRGIDFSALAESDLVSLAKPPQETE